MNEVANHLSQLERVAEEVSLRQTIVQSLRAGVGPEHLSTMSAESKLAMCLMTLDRPEEAEPLLAHVVRGRESALGPDDNQTLSALAWNAGATKRLGRLADTRLLQEQVLAGYERRGESEGDQAQLAALNLASTLSVLHERDEAARLVRTVVDVRRRTLGPDDPRTLDAATLLASVTSDRGTGETGDGAPESS